MPDATPPRPLTAPGVVAGLLADVADARAQLADVQHGAGAWIREAVARETAGLTARLAEVTADRDHLAAKLAETLAANQRWAETLADVQQRHAEVKRQRDAHKARADHYEGLWRAEHGLPPEGK
jgi:chromosome segregation ATPase